MASYVPVTVCEVALAVVKPVTVGVAITVTLPVPCEVSPLLSELVATTVYGFEVVESTAVLGTVSVQVPLDNVSGELVPPEL